MNLNLENINAISQAILYIEKHLYENISAFDVATAVSYSYYHFHRYFRMVVGETIGSYIRSRRLSQGAWQLVYSSTKIIDIGTALFFESAESFTRAFKLRYGITPTDYRKNGIYTTLKNRKAENVERDFSYYYSKIEPEIVTFPSTYLLGTHFETSISNGESFNLWEDFQKNIPALMMNRNRYEVFEKSGFCKVDSFEIEVPTTVFLGFETDETSVYKEFVQKTLPSAKYAKFTHVGTVDRLINTYQYIWGVWFPKNNFQLGEHEDFECYTERFSEKYGNESEVDIYFSIK